jgi:hypothetical protein
MSTFTNNNVSSGDVVRASDHNTQGANIAAVVNGDIDNANISATAAIAGSKLADGAITPAKQSGNLIYVVKLTGGASSSTTPLTLGSITIPSQTFAYYLDVKAHWTATNDVDDDEFLFRVRTGTAAAAGDTIAQASIRHTGSANTRAIYSIAGVVTDATSGSAFAPFEVAASTAQSINAGITRTIGTGTINTSASGVMVARVIPK